LENFSTILLCYLCAKFGDLVFSRFGFIVRTDRVTDRHTKSQTKPSTRPVNSASGNRALVFERTLNVLLTDWMITANQIR